MTAPILAIDTVAVPHGGLIGMMHCPGRCGGSYGVRDLAVDLDAIEAWGADVLVSLNEAHEFPRLGVPQFEAAARAARFRWLHAPIPDFEVPGAAFTTAWASAGPIIAETLANGGRVAIHCAAGLGRTGTLAARLLVDLGVEPEQAIALVRKARPGTIETERQAQFVRRGPRLLNPS